MSCVARRDLQSQQPRPGRWKLTGLLVSYRTHTHAAQIIYVIFYLFKVLVFTIILITRLSADIKA